jgi:uncharacterized protein DUF3224
MKDAVSGTYRTTHWQEQEYSQAGAKLTVAEKELSFDGGIQGRAVQRASVVHLADGSNQFAGHLEVTGRIGDREGSFVLAETGSGARTGATGTWTVVAGSASGGLAGLTGEGSWKWEPTSQDVTYTLSYEL